MNDRAYDDVIAALNGSSDPLLVVCHISPDGDAIGAAVSVALYCERIGRRAILVNDDPILPRYWYLPKADQFLRTSQITEQFHTVVAVDCADERRMGQTISLAAPDRLLINIDHHDTNRGFGDMNLVDPKAAATCLVLYRLFQRANAEFDEAMALAIYSGIVFDTGGFRYENTTPEIHRAAGFLLERGVQPFYVADRLLEAITPSQAQLVKLGLESLAVTPDGRVAYVAISREMFHMSGADDEDTDVLLPYTRSLVGVEVGIVFRERSDGTVKVSLRSRERVDVAVVAVHFSGGGHIRAAGCTVDGPLSQAVKRVVEAVVSEVHDAFGESARDDS